MFLHVATTYALLGMIWTVQLVHYPLFRHVGRSAFPAYHARHVVAICWVVVPLMIGELATAVVLVTLIGPNICFWVSLALIALNWLSTFRVQVPLHSQLQVAFDDEIQSRLERSNWLRTWAWTLRAALLVPVVFSVWKF